MSAEAETTIAPPAAPSPWPQRVRWFLAELSVVVVGILLALSLQSWWQDRENAQRSAVYLEQVLADARLTSKEFSASVKEDEVLFAAAQRMNDALYGKDALQPGEALQWLSLPVGRFTDPMPALGNVYSLIDNGEIRHIRNPAVHAAIVEYAARMKRNDSTDLHGQIARMLGANDLESLVLARAGLPPPPPALVDPAQHDTAPVRDYLARYEAAWPSLRQDPEFRHAQSLRLKVYNNLAFYHLDGLQATEKLIAAIEAGH